MTKILYHPKFEPSEHWLRAMLLFYDSVHSIVPKTAPYTPTPGVDRLCSKVTDAFIPLSPTRQDLQYDWPEYHALTDVLRTLSDQSVGQKQVGARFNFDTRGVPSLNLGSGVRVHTDKMADVLRMDLINLGLAEPTEKPHWLRVDSRVADLVLSMLANRMVMNRSGFVGTASDQETSFAVAAKSALNRGRQELNAEATLASAILTMGIPSNLAELPLDRYLDIRKRYEEQREAFRLAMNDLQKLYLQTSLQNSNEFQRELEQVVVRFGAKMRALRQGQWGQQVQRWSPVTVGGIVAIVAALISAPVVAVSAASVGIVIQIVQTLQGQRSYISNIAQTQALLVELNDELRWNRSLLGQIFR